MESLKRNKVSPSNWTAYKLEYVTQDGDGVVQLHCDNKMLKKAVILNSIEVIK